MTDSSPTALARPSQTATPVTPSHAMRGRTAPKTVTVTVQGRHAMIAEAAYYLAEQRGFAPGHELEDWYFAEGQVDAAIGTSAAPPAEPDSAR